MEINGFEIEKYNQYDLQDKAKYSTCPICSHTRKKAQDKCMSLHWDTGLGVCHHCGEVIQLHTFKKKNNKVKSYSKPKWNNNTDLSDNVVKWFEKRNIDQFTLRHMKITESVEYMPQVKKERNVIQFNYFRDAELINIKYRDGAKNFKLFSGAELIFYNLDCIKYSDEVIITEGEIDALSYFSCGLHNVVSTPNGSTTGNVNLEYLDNCIDYFENKTKIYLALDNDLPGKNVIKELIRRFGSNRCYLVDFKDCKDANEYLVKYGKQSLVDTITNAEEVPIEGVSAVNDFRKSFENYLINGMQQGYKIGKENFDKIFSTYTGQVIGVTGIPSHGKSDFVDQMVLGYAENYNWKTAICSPENKPNEIHAGKMIGKLCGKWVNYESQIKTEWFNKAVNYLHDHIKYIDMEDKFELEAILEKTERLVFKYGIKCLVLDPYNKIRLGRSLDKSITEYTNDYLILLDEFARKHDILIILVAHPRKPSLQEGKTYMPTFYDVKGGGEFYDMLPHGLLVHRNFDQDVITVKVLKCKFAHLGETGKYVLMRWHKDSGRFMEFDGNPQEIENCAEPKFDLTNPFDDETKKEIPVNSDFDYRELQDDEVPF